ncbi:MAG: undecaprenyl-diphosphate phosphatase [Acidobacteria bacterium]|nr:undecaprenyl-diphosphate phosphatase [Acidobacteriota bacterium]
MALIWIIILAVVQGLAEFLPVSSSGHLVILGALSGIKEEDELAFFIVLHAGTLLATVVYFRKELWDLARSLFRRENSSLRYVGLIVTTMVPTAILGFSLKKWVEAAISKPAFAGGALLFSAAFLWATKYLPEGKKDASGISYLDAFLIGTAQGVSATFRGVTRSGATISAALARGLTREEAFRFSFLASLPAVAGAAALEARGVLKAANDMGAWHLVLGAALAFGIGLFALAFLKKTVVGNKFHWFSVWCVIAGVGGLIVGFCR